MEKLNSAQQAMLKSHPCFLAASQDNQAAIYDSAYIKVLKKGEFLQRRGDSASAYYGLFQGRIKVNAVNAEGKTFTLKYVQPGVWFGEISLLDGIARTHDCEAIEPCQVIMIPKAAFENHVMNDLKALQILSKQLCQRVRNAMNLAEQMTIQSLPERLAARLLELYAETGEQLHVNQQDIAHLLGVSRQSVSKLLILWSEQGWIQLDYHKIVVQQPDQLKALCTSAPVPFN